MADYPRSLNRPLELLAEASIEWNLDDSSSFVINEFCGDWSILFNDDEARWSKNI